MTARAQKLLSFKVKRDYKSTIKQPHQVAIYIAYMYIVSPNVFDKGLIITNKNNLLASTNNIAVCFFKSSENRSPFITTCTAKTIHFPETWGIINVCYHIFPTHGMKISEADDKWIIGTPILACLGCSETPHLHALLPNTRTHFYEHLLCRLSLYRHDSFAV